MRTRILVGVIWIPVLIVVLVFLPAIFAGVATGVISAVCMLELRHALGEKKNRFDILYSVFAFLPALFNSLDMDDRLITSVYFVALAAVFFEYALRYEKNQVIKVRHIFGTVFAVYILPYSMTSVVALRTFTEFGRVLVLAPFVAAFLTDAGAYFVGVFMGKRKCFPRISPKKTVAGLVGGIVIGVGAMFLYWWILTLIYPQLAFPYVAVLVTGLFGALATIFGDLAFSLIKRVADIKDYGKLLPGHGGMLDRFDSLVFAAPVVFICITTFFPVLAI